MGKLLVPALVAVLAACSPEEETGPRIPIESADGGNGAEAESAENGGDGDVEDAGNGEGEEAANGEADDADGGEEEAANGDAEDADGEGEESGEGDAEDADGEGEESGEGEDSGNGEEDGFDGRGEIFEITADDSMRFGLARIEVISGQPVTVVLRNIGSMSKEAMGHNFILLDLGTDPTAFASDAIAHRENEHIPPGREDQVIVATDILGPGESEEITFIAPETAGDYDYICSFPGHTAAGMVGVMTVRSGTGEAESEEAGAEENGDPDAEAAEGNGEDGEDGESGDEAGDGEGGDGEPEENGEAAGEEEAGEAGEDGEEEDAD